MTLIAKIREMAARHALEREIYRELSELSDAELQDLNLSRFGIAEVSRIHARSAQI